MTASRLSVTERLVAFVRSQQAKGVPPPVLHETKRLILNQLKASVAATDVKVVRNLYAWAKTTAPVGGGGAHALWFGEAMGLEQACMVNAALFEVLDFNDTYIPCFMHAVSGVLPAVLAEAESLASSGADTLTALALGIEVELACAAMLLPSAYFRGFIAGGITGAIGGAAACAILRGLDDTGLRDALGLAMNTGMGFYQTAGSDGFSYLMGAVARNGLTAADLASRGIGAPRLAFEGDRGMFTSYCDEPVEKIESVLGALGSDETGLSWRLMGQTYKTVPTETITHGPIECVMALLARSNGRKPARLRFGVEAIVIKIADERTARFGAPSSELEAKFDLRHCAAAAWIRGRFTLAEMEAGAFTDPEIRDLHGRIDLFHDPRHKTFDGASLVVDYEDGSSDEINIPAFLGTPVNPMSDADLASLFKVYAGPLLPPGRPEAILQAVWSLDAAPTIAPFVSLLSFH